MTVLGNDGAGVTGLRLAADGRHVAWSTAVDGPGRHVEGAWIPRMDR